MTQLSAEATQLPPDTLPSPIHADRYHALQTPVPDRSFFMTTERVNAAGLMTPVDDFSGIPLPIVPSKQQLPSHQSEVADWHHPFHPKEHPALKTAGGIALRNCRIQLVHRNFHNESPTRYHRFFEGPPLTTEPQEQFRTVVLACAGYMPKQAISTKTGEPKVVDLTASDLARLSMTTKRVAAGRGEGCKCGDAGGKSGFGYRNFRYGYDAVREFLAEYALEQPTDHINQRLIDEFLYTTDATRKEYLGHLLLVKKVEVAVEVVEDHYRIAQDAKALHPLMPRSARAFVKYKLGNPEMRRRLFPRLAAQLAVFHGITGLTIRGDRGIISHY